MPHWSTELPGNAPRYCPHWLYGFPPFAIDTYEIRHGQPPRLVHHEEAVALLAGEEAKMADATTCDKCRAPGSIQVSVGVFEREFCEEHVVDGVRDLALHLIAVMKQDAENAPEARIARLEAENAQLREELGRKP